jgi:SAM-dependent methyltransferase
MPGDERRHRGAHGPVEADSCGSAVIHYDAELQLHNEQFRAALDIRAADSVLDIGCGTGQTTREAAVVASDGDALGVDIDRGMIARARALAHREGVPNVRFEVGDVQTHPFRSGAFDVAISRFGTMFFRDPDIAYRNIASAVRAGGRLVMMVWRAHDRNEWAVAIDQALGERGLAAAHGPDPFSLAEPPTVRQILAAAGFADSEFRDVDVPVYYGPDVDAALTFVGRFANVSEALSRSDPRAAGTILARLRAMLQSQASERGVWLGSRAWIVTARRQ